MPRRTIQRNEENNDIENINENDYKQEDRKKPVGDFLKNNYFEMLKYNNKKVECPVCYEEIDCKNCFCLLDWGHYLHLHEWIKISSKKCPICR